MNYITLKTFDSAIDAHILRNRLEDEGIECHIRDEHTVTMYPLWNFAIGGIRLQVLERDFARAHALLTEIESMPFTDDQNELIHCPLCNSTELISGFKSFKTVKGILSLIVSFILTVFPIYANPVYRCRECDNEFHYRKK